MSYQVLARKWRPKNFADLVGQEHVVRALSNALNEQRLHHAYLLTGTRGVGKTTIARILAKSLNCERGVSAQPCGVCDNCRQIEAGRFVDLLEIDAASNTGIDNIREVIENAQYAPTTARYKVYIIDEVHMLSKHAFNAILKTLEEPPAHVKFILATTDPQKVPVTVLSRCLQFSLRNMRPQHIASHLANVLNTENVPFEPAALALLARAAAGSMRDALSLLDQSIAYGLGRVEEAGVRAMLGVVDRRHLFVLLEQLSSGDHQALLKEGAAFAAEGGSLAYALESLALVLHQLALAQIAPDALDDDDPERDVLLALSTLFSAEDLQLYYQIAVNGKQHLPFAPDELTGFNMTLLRMCAFRPLLPTDSAPLLRESSSRNPSEANAHASQAVDVQAVLSRFRKTPNSTAPNSTAPNSTAPNSTAPNSTAPNSTAPNSTAPNSTAPNSTAPNSTAPNSTAPNSTAPNSTAPSETHDFAWNGDWSTLIAQLSPRLGAGRAVLQHTELVRCENACFVLRLPPSQSKLAQMSHPKLCEALSQHFGQPLNVEFEFAQPHGETPVLQHARQQREHLAVVQQQFADDPMVQRLMQEFDATLLPDSLQLTASTQA